MSTITKKITLVNKSGLHARPAVGIVKCTDGLHCTVQLKTEEVEVDGRSVMELLMLAAPYGEDVIITTKGRDSQLCMDNLVEFFESGLGEGIYKEDPKSGIFGKIKNVFRGDK